VEQIELSNQTSENSNSNHEQINNESDKETQAIVYPVRPNKGLRLGERAALLLHYQSSFKVTMKSQQQGLQEIV
jgi:hypothetical protein